MSFYQAVLGCVLERTLEELGLYQLRAGSALIDLVPIGSQLGGEHPPDRGRPNMDHFCLKLKDVDWTAIRAHLTANGIDNAEPQRRYGADGYGLSIYIRDPEGNVVELKASGDAQTC